MMDELDLLKKDWQNKEEHLPKLSYNDIHTMLWKKSHSIVKWILIISILEFLLPHLLYLLPSMPESVIIYEKLGIKNIATGIWIMTYVVIFYFIYQFYKRYKEISLLDSAKDLMRKIIKVRRTVKHYVIFSLSALFLTCVMIIIGMYFSDNLMEIFPTDGPERTMAPEKFKSILIGSMAIISIGMIAVMAIIYFLLYGLLLRKLNKNYRELKRLEL